MLDLSTIIKSAHRTAALKGWHERERNPLELGMLIVTEIAEFVEDERIPADEREWGQEGYRKTPEGKPIGPVVELADALIRICDAAKLLGYDLEGATIAKLAFNKTRPYRHGGKLA